MRNENKELVIITGVSGAGKSTAIGFLEDVGYYCIDNMPPVLLNTFLELLENKGERNKIAVVIDIRSTENFESLIEVLNEKEKFNYDIKVVYLDIKTHIVLKRYKLTRRKHPYADRFNGDIAQALAYEREILSSVRLRADHIIDTSDISGNELRDRLTQILLGSDRDVMNIHVMSFGFKHGLPMEADLVFDVRCLPNPFYDEVLRPKTGLDPDVRDYVMENDECRGFVERYTGMLDYLLPLYRKEGKSQLVVAVGCTGGHHRSVALAHFTCDYCSGKGVKASVTHRDIQKF